MKRHWAALAATGVLLFFACLFQGVRVLINRFGTTWLAVIAVGIIVAACWFAIYSCFRGEQG